MRPILVVPADEVNQLAAEGIALVGHEQQSGALILERADEPLDDRYAPILTDCAESLPDTSTTAPLSEPEIDELPAVVGDEVSWDGPHLLDGPAEERSHLNRGRHVRECGDADRTTGIVIDDDSDPPAERPLLGQSPGQPGGPESERSRYRGEIAEPDVIGAFRRYDVLQCLGGRRGWCWIGLAEISPDRRRGKMQADGQSTWAILTLPMEGQRVLSLRTM